MIVEIEKVIVKDRIRKDFGDIQELAKDIKQNGLINPPVINKNYELLAGERRLRACKSLGWSQIEVRMMDTNSEDHDFDIEVSENEVRKDFSKTEREAIYTKRVEAKMRGKFTSTVIEAQEQVAKEMGTSRTNMQHEKVIIENRDLLDPSDFADWDEGKLSTNKAFRKVKDKQKTLEEENDKLRKALSESEAKRIAEKNQKKEVIKEVEVLPDDYEELKKKAKMADGYKKDFLRVQGEYENMAEKWKKSESEKDEIVRQINAPEIKRNTDLKANCIFFCSGVRNFLEKYGGYKFFKHEIDALPEYEKKSYRHAISEMRSWLDQMLDEVTVEV